MEEISGNEASMTSIPEKKMVPVPGLKTTTTTKPAQIKPYNRISVLSKVISLMTTLVEGSTDSLPTHKLLSGHLKQRTPKDQIDSQIASLKQVCRESIFTLELQVETEEESKERN